jgi:hypothetical protein
VGDTDREAESGGTRKGDIPKRLKLLPGVAFLHSALFMMDAVVLVDGARCETELGSSDLG